MNWRERYEQWRKRRVIARLRAEEQRIVQADMRERAAIAAAFNHRYVAGARYDRSCDDNMAGDFSMHMKQGFHWMCPCCNNIHAALKFSIWVGVIYPACCTYPEGIRTDELKEGYNLKRPLGYCGPEGLLKRLLRIDLEPEHPELKDAPY